MHGKYTCTFFSNEIMQEYRLTNLNKQTLPGKVLKIFHRQRQQSRRAMSLKPYSNARNNPKIGYMKRMKEEWDNLHPELSHFNPEQLRQQATFVASKGITLDANLAKTVLEPSSTPSHQPSTAENQSLNNNSPISAEFEDQITDEKDGSHFDFNIDRSLLNDLQDKFSKFYNEHINKPLEERKYDIKNLQRIT